ncbi:MULTISPECIES: ATP-binding protein [unclassified Streptomyces]|uniref:ATP-binding protein n=1 Tax=unclassified Streptomyces TaxID=2593676 RepID=UPI002B1E2018|nr:MULTISPECIES: ATP-binding protein [unclassified Streptomyces]
MREERQDGMGRTMLKAVTVPDDGSQREPNGTSHAEGSEATTPPAGQRRFFSMQFTSTARGARLARQAAVRHLGQWEFSPASEVSCTVALVVAELAANAVRHGRVPGRNFLLSVTYETGTRRIRVEVSDACPELPPVDPSVSADDDESGRGLVLVDALADRWGAAPRTPLGKTVWAECRAG